MKSFFMKSLKSLALIAFVSSLLILSGCGDDPEKENVPEQITRATLTFTPAGGAPISVFASDDDGDGVADLVVNGSILLDKDKEYTLDITLINGFAEPTDEEYDITAEVEEEGYEHQFFFSWSAGIFSNPTLTGNIIDEDNPSLPLSTINYVDLDDNDRPVGLKTTWTTAVNAATGTFRVMLRHQPDGAKTDTSTSEDGDPDLDITFNIAID